MTDPKSVPEYIQLVGRCPLPEVALRKAIGRMARVVRIATRKNLVDAAEATGHTISQVSAMERGSLPMSRELAEWVCCLADGLVSSRDIDMAEGKE